MAGGAIGPLGPLSPHYAVILCDIWGCLHNGVAAFPAAVQSLQRWQDEGRIVILLTNAPRPAESVRKQLDRLGIPARCYNAVVTSGDTGLAAARADYPEQAFHFIGSSADRDIIAETGIKLSSGNPHNPAICTGFHDGYVDDIAHHESEMQQMLIHNAIMLCLNPDRMVIRGTRAELCAGALGERYQQMGGVVRYFGKPYQPIYDYAAQIAEGLIKRPLTKPEIIAIGDGVHTDLQGAYHYGLDFAFITGGIEQEKIAAMGVDAFFEEAIADNLPKGYRPALIASHLA